MNIRYPAAAYAIFTGIAIFFIWVLLIFTRQVPELVTQPGSTALHLTAEFLTAVALAGAGINILTRQFFWKEVYMFSMGMLIYSVIQNAGYFIQRNQITYAAMYAVFGFLAMIFSILILFEQEVQETQSRTRHYRTTR
jgi:hypothetical protein